MSKTEKKTIKTNARFDLKGNIVHDIIEAKPEKSTAQIDKDALLASTAAIGAQWKAASKGALDQRQAANDLAFLFVVHMIAVFSNNRVKTAGKFWPGRGGIRALLHKVLEQAGVKGKAADRYMAVASNVELHTFAILRNSTVKQVEHAMVIYGWDSVAKIQAAFASPLAWNNDCETSLQRYIPLIVEDCQHHEDKGKQAIEDERKLISKRYFKEMDKAEIDRLDTSERETILPNAKQQDVYDAAEQAAQLAKQEKETKQ